MLSVARIIAINGGMDKLADRPICLKIPGFDRLCIEAVGCGPRGLPLVSVAHYYQQNGESMADPDIVFEVVPAGGCGDRKMPAESWHPIEITQHAVGRYSRMVWREGEQILHKPAEVRDVAHFARVWDRNIREQGFVVAAEEQLRPAIPAETPSPTTGVQSAAPAPSGVGTFRLRAEVAGAPRLF